MWVLLLKYGIATQAYPDWEFIWWHGMCGAVSKIHVVTSKMEGGENKKKNCQFLKHAFKCSLLSMISCHWFFDFPLFFFLQQQLPADDVCDMSFFGKSQQKCSTKERELDFFTETSFPLSLPSTLGFERTLGYTSLCVLQLLPPTHAFLSLHFKISIYFWHVQKYPQKRDKLFSHFCLPS